MPGIPIAEVFGPTIQGEGSLAGSVSHFIRVGGCDYACSWCDSAHAVLAENVRRLPRLSEDDIYEQVTALPASPWVTISGGNPALYDMSKLVNRLRLSGYKVAVETQGSIWKDWFTKVDLLTVSPKPPSSGNETNPTDLAAFYYNTYNIKPTDAMAFKVVVFDDADFEYAVRVHSTWPRAPFFLSVGTRMGGLNGDFDAGLIDGSEEILERYRWLCEKVIADGRIGPARVLPQLHALVWGHEQGH